MKKGAVDYTRTHASKLSLVRKLLPDGTTHVARLGKLYFRKGRTEYVASVPAMVTGKTPRGKVQRRATKLPVDILGSGRLMQPLQLLVQLLRTTDWQASPAVQERHYVSQSKSKERS